MIIGKGKKEKKKKEEAKTLLLWWCCCCRKSMKFSTLSESEIGKIAEVQVWKGAYYDQFKKPIPGGLLDPRMVPFNLSMSLFSRLFYLAYYISIIGFAYLICLFYSHALPRGFIKL